MTKKEIPTEMCNCGKKMFFMDVEVDEEFYSQIFECQHCKLKHVRLYKFYRTDVIIPTAK